MDHNDTRGRVGVAWYDVLVLCAAAAVVAVSLAAAGSWAWYVGVASLVGAALLGGVGLVRRGLSAGVTRAGGRAVVAQAASAAALWGVVIGGWQLLLTSRSGLPASIAVGVLVVLVGLAASTWVVADSAGGPGAVTAALVGLIAAGLPTALLGDAGGASAGAAPTGPGLSAAEWAAVALAGVTAVVCGIAVWLTVSQSRRPAGAAVQRRTVTGLMIAFICAAGMGVALSLRSPGGPLMFLVVPAAVWMVTAATPDRPDRTGTVGPEGAGRTAAEAEQVDGEQALAISEERRRATQLQILNRLALVLNSEEDETRMLDQVLRGATQLLGARSGSLYLMADGRLQLEAFSIVRGKGAPAEMRRPGTESRTLALRALAEKRVIRHTAAGDSGAGDQGLVAAPLVRADGEVLGCFVMAGITGAGATGFSAADEMMAGTLAAHVTVALQNRQRLEQEQQVAEYLQRAMLPRAATPVGLELDITYESASEAALVGGDFYDVMPVDATKTCLAVGDVCGKGLPAATEMAMVRHTIRAFASLGLHAGRWLTLCNQAAVADGEVADYITVALVLADTSTRTLDYAVAGHPPPIVALPHESWELAGRAGLPIGSWRGQQYETHRVVLPKGATLILYTDGLFEAHSPGGSMFGEDGLASAVKRVAAEPLAGAAARLVAAARAHAGGRLADDVVVVAVRIPGSAGEVRG